MVSDSILQQVTIAAQHADEIFERVGGSTRHWVRDCFLPELEARGLTIVPLTPANDADMPRASTRDSGSSGFG